MSNFWGPGTVTKAEKLKTERVSGQLVQYHYADVGYDTGDVYIDDGLMLGAQFDRRRSRSRMPLEFMYVTGENIDWSKYGAEDVSAQKKTVNAFVLNFKDFQREGRGLYFYSKTKGSGKSMIACAAANEILKTHDISVKFTSVDDYIQLVREKDEASRKEVKAITESGLLILDDIGARLENKDWIVSALIQLINWRCVNFYPTIFTSNVWMDDLKIDPRISSKIHDVSVPVVMPEINVGRQIADKHTKEFLKKVMQ